MPTAAESFERVATTPHLYEAFTGSIGDANAPSRLVACRELMECSDIIDVGCGPGVFVDTLGNAGWQGSYVGLEASPAMLAKARARLNRDSDPLGTLQSVTFDPMPTHLEPCRRDRDEHQHGVLVRHVLEHMAEPYVLLDAVLGGRPRIAVLVFSALLSNRSGPTLVDRHLGVDRFSHSRPNMLATVQGWGLRVRIVPEERLHVREEAWVCTRI